jgi:hypothetical protein
MNSELINKIDVLPGWLSVHEGQFLYKAAQQVRKTKGVLVEIGSFQGKSTIYMAKTKQKVFAIDPHRGKLDHGRKISPTLTAFNKNIKDFHVENNVFLIKKTSKIAVSEWDKKIKLLFIDGLHDEKNAGFDYLNWSPFLVQGGIIAMHDSFCGWKGAQKVAINNIVLNDNYCEIGVVGSIIYGVRGEGNLISITNRLFKRSIILMAFWIYSKRSLPQWLSFIFIHRLLKLLLLNRYTLSR